jgi:REP element-mobilizing transposase RayT
MEPIYTLTNTTPAYQLNWSVSLFGKIALPPPPHWLDQLKAVTERDGVRILEAHLEPPNVGQFFVSTRPEVAPSAIVRSVKGRWQHLLQAQHAIAFRRNYFIGSVGSAHCEVLDRYVAGQTDKHVMVDPRVQERLYSVQFHDAAIDLTHARTSNHGRFIYNLQIVLENVENLHDIREAVLLDSRAMVIRVAAKKDWLLSRIGLLSNHIHILLGAHVAESPASVALSLMNNLAYVQQMKPVLRFSYYAGTFGPYDLDAVRRRL